MSILGLATREELAEVTRRLDSLPKDLERRLRELERRPSPLKVPQTINLAGESLSLAELLEQLLEKVRPLIESQLRETIEEVLRTVDWQDLTDRAWNEVDLDQLTEKLAAALIEKVPDLVDREALRDELVETILDEDFDLDDLTDRVTTALSSRLEVHLAKPED